MMFVIVENIFFGSRAREVCVICVIVLFGTFYTGKIDNTFNNTFLRCVIAGRESSELPVYYAACTPNEQAA